MSLMIEDVHGQKPVRVGIGGTLPISFELPFVSPDARPIVAQVILGLLLVAVVIFVPRGVIDFFGGRTRLSLAYLRRSLRETSL